MNGEDQLRSGIELLRSAHAQIGAGRTDSRDIRDIVRRTEQAIAATYARISDSDRAMRKWWYQPEIPDR